MIHPTAVIDAGAVLDSSVEVGPFAVIGASVEIDAGTQIGPHVVLKGPMRIGRDNRIFQFASVGEDPQDKKYGGEPTRLEIGDRNQIREFVTLHRGTAQDKGVTRIGDDNLFMAYTHVAHDCVIGDHVIMANAASLGGHVEIHDWAILGGFTIVHQFCRIGAHAFCAMGSVLSKDVPPYVMVGGHPAEPHGINAEGLRRRGFPADSIQAIKRAYRALYMANLRRDQAVERILGMTEGAPELKALLDFISASARSIIR
ncbi:acyl-ACP--UDP-N-acetylglucosamine O-acyltransferase [Thiorhodococcus mannitoliphagus]|uniref:Acyl-[acyl-carrier-protein]--UDP-N-acetylglucosamine O-acyltransferase n=1 Tax=Thiorhodococcus mannitoliphagus TaxID=329406 RepID=A0A6P1DTR6_9GAMM|nr:acyl-ACP--UDP-N-acetylglucosamine O-acyltransferase [Thiorhodococcus mannitoliphagus]NEX20351.1 acyl-ACP--UDP-N-acetylglucosamine O-acyltransferase [Thiorhodococcus mannitoliphagus]